MTVPVLHGSGIVISSGSGGSSCSISFCVPIRYSVDTTSRQSSMRTASARIQGFLCEKEARRLPGLLFLFLICFCCVICSDLCVNYQIRGGGVHQTLSDNVGDQRGASRHDGHHLRDLVLPCACSDHNRGNEPDSLSGNCSTAY